MTTEKMSARDRKLVHDEIDEWLNRVEARPLSFDNGEWHSIKIDGAYAGHASDDTVIFHFMIERSERVDL